MVVKAWVGPTDLFANVGLLVAFCAPATPLLIFSIAKFYFIYL